MTTYKEIDCTDMADHHMPPPGYIVLFNPTHDDVVRVHQATSGVFIFIFIVGRTEAVADFSGLPKSDYIVRPILLGDLTRQQAWAAAMACIGNSMRVALT